MSKEVVEEIILKKIRYCLGTLELPAELVDSIDNHVDHRYEPMIGRYVFNAFTEIFGQEIHQKYEVGIRVPKNWWEHFKRDVLPGWYKKKYRVKEKTLFRTIEIDHKALLKEIPEFLRGPTVMYTPKINQIDVYRIKNEEE